MPSFGLAWDGVRIEPFTLDWDPKLSNGRELSFHHRQASKEAILELAAENAIFSIICVVFTKEEFLNSSLVDTTSE